MNHSSDEINLNNIQYLILNSTEFSICHLISGHNVMPMARWCALYIFNVNIGIEKWREKKTYAQAQRQIEKKKILCVLIDFKGDR